MPVICETWESEPLAPDETMEKTLPFGSKDLLTRSVILPWVSIQISTTRL